MVRKVTNSQFRSLLSGVYVPMTSFYFTGDWAEKFTEGKVALSVKFGKRRKMLKGRMVVTDFVSSQCSSGQLVLRFRPNNYAKAMACHT